MTRWLRHTPWSVRSECGGYEIVRQKMITRVSYAAYRRGDDFGYEFIASFDGQNGYLDAKDVCELNRKYGGSP